MGVKKKILFRADGNTITGLGHLYRLFALVEIYKEYYEITFLTQIASTKSVIPQDYNVVFIPDNINIEHEPNWLLTHFSPKEYIAILDGYDFSSNYQKQLKEKGYFVVYVDDLIDEEMFADIVVNHSPNVLKSHYKGRATQLALGTDYAILRPTFLQAAKEDREINAIHSAFVCFGGADKLDLSLKVAQALIQIPEIQNIHVVLGEAYLYKGLDQLKQEYAQIKLYRNLNETGLHQLMMQCQVAIAPSSTILYELCCVKMLILSGYFVENQRNIYNALSGVGAIAKGGDFSHYSNTDFKEKIIQLLREQNHSNYIEEQRKLFDGNSKYRFLKLLNDAFVSFRKAKDEDMKQVLDWSNDELVRLNSYNSEPIDIKEHKKWFYSKIKDKKALLLIALYDNKEAGIVRYELQDKFAVIGISISKHFRRRKLAPSFLSKSAEEYFKLYELPVFAYIKEENVASVKAFENAGYIFCDMKMIDGINSFVYKLEKNDVIR